MASAYIEAMRVEAEAFVRSNNDATMATSPAVRTPGNNIRPLIDVPMEEVVDFMQDRGFERDELQSMAIYTYEPGAEISGKGVHKNVPVWFQSGDQRVVHYPVVGLCVGSNVRPQERSMNFTLRHELRHLEQGLYTTPLYQNERIVNATRWSGTVSACLGSIGVATAAYETVMSSADNSAIMLGLMSGAVALAGAIAERKPAQFVHRITPREIDADIFALRTRDFQPVHYAS